MFNLTAEIVASNANHNLVKVSSPTHSVNIYTGQSVGSQITKNDAVQMIKAISPGKFDYAIPYYNIYNASAGMVVWDYSDGGYGKPLYLGAIVHCIEGMARSASIHPYA